MPSRLVNQNLDATLRFGGGVFSRASEDEIDVRECAEGKNFVLDRQNREFKNRKPFDLAATAPNGGSINGFASLLKTDGTVSFLVQAGTAVYDWDGTNFTSVGTVNASAKLRGRIENNWNLDDKVLITDLALLENVKEWDGTTFQDVTFTDEASSAFGDFKAKYCFIANERAVFGNVKDSSSTTPHLLVGSKRSDYTQITVVNRPSSALSDEDPYFVATEDLKPINGLVESFGVVAISTEKGNMWKLTGSSAKDFAINPLFQLSGASGDESVLYTGNDIMYGRPGRIEALSGVERFGDVEGDDLTQWIADQVEDVTGWTGVYNRRLQRVYWFPEDGSSVWVLFKPMLGSNLSPWSEWTTLHSLAFQPTAVMNAFDPSDGLEYTWMGDASGNIYRLEGAGSGDAGLRPIEVERQSRLISAPLDATTYRVIGYVKYRKNAAFDLRIQLEFAGEYVGNVIIDDSITGATGGIYWGGAWYWGGSNYYGIPFQGRLTRRKFAAPGQSNEFQVRLSVLGSADFEINEVGLRFEAAK